MTENYQPIPHRLKNVAVGGHVAGAVDILDDDLGINQAKINQDRIDADEGLDHKIDNLDGRLTPQIENNTENIELIRQEITDVPVTTEVDPYPTRNSTKPVMSGGVFQKNIQAEIVVGDPQGNWSSATAEEMFERCQAMILLLNGNDVAVVADHTAVVSPDGSKIYREPDSDGESYTDWMYYNNAWYDIATYTFPGTDDEPTEDSLDLITSGAVFDYCAVAGTKIGEV